jgi:hypothetical protein
MYSSVYELAFADGRTRRGFQIMKPLTAAIEIIEGVKIIKNLFAHKFASPVQALLKLKNQCFFEESDFSFLQYLGSAITRSEGNIGRCRSVALVSDSDLRNYNVELPADIIYVGVEMIMLSDSVEYFI